MKILMTTVGFAPVGGLEIYTRDVASGLVDLGHEVTVWAVLDEALPLRGVTVEELRPTSRLAVSAQFRLLRTRLGHRVNEHKTKFDLVLCMHPRLAPGVHKGIGDGPPFWIWTFGTDIWGDWPPRLKEAVDSAAKVATISSFTARRILETAPLANVPVIFPTVDTSRFVLSTELPEPAVDPVLFTVSRIDLADAYKGHDNVIRAIPIMEESLGRRVIYRIAGSGNGPERLRSIGRDCGVEDRLVFLGRLSDARLAEEYRQCDLFVMPSRMDPAPDGSLRGEGFGIVYIEAQATGRPVVVSAQAAAPEAIRANETGVSADPYSPESIAEACLGILSRPDRGRAMGEAGRSFVEETFGHDHFRERLSSALGGR